VLLAALTRQPHFEIVAKRARINVIGYHYAEILPQACSNPIESGLESLPKKFNYSFIDIIPNLHDFISSLVNHMVWFIAKTPVLITAYCFSWLFQPVFHNLLVK